VLKRLQDGLDSSTEYSQFIKQKAAIDAKYAADLEKLVKLLPCNNLNSVDILNETRSLNVEIARIIHTFADAALHMDKQITNFVASDPEFQKLKQVYCSVI
jgi:hypothetical protein